MIKLVVSLLIILLATCGEARADVSTRDLQAGFANPPDDAKPMVRWWWFGPAVEKAELKKEIALMKEGGFGGFEIQPTYPLALDGQYPGLKNFKFMSKEFLDSLGFADDEGKAEGLRVDLTLGSGWPYGGPMFTREEAVQSIRDGGSVSIKPEDLMVSAPPPPPAGRGREGAEGPIVAALLGPIPGAKNENERYIKLEVAGGAARLPADRKGATQVRFIMYAPADLMRVKRAAFGAEGYIVDHYSPPAIEKFIQQIAQPEISAFGSKPPFSIFCDSLEVQGEGWTPDFPAEFQKRRGYDLVPLLPALYDSTFPKAPEIRADYGRTVAEVFNANFVDRFEKLARANHTRFRLQGYGTPPTTLSTYAKVDIIEGENYSQRVFSGTRWAASASHLLNRPVTSSEAFTWLHSPVFMAAPIDIKAESNLQFLNGINQFLYHGWPYTAPGVEYPGWRFYAAAVFNEKNPWWIAMPEINKYLARLSYLLRQGSPVNDVALYLPEEDAYTKFTPSSLEMAAAGGRGILNGMVGSYIPPILDAGYNYDFVDDGLIASLAKVSPAELRFGTAHYRAVVLPAVSRIPVAVYRQLAAFADAGGVLIAVKQVPSLAPGYRATEAEHDAIKEISARLFSGPAARGILIPAEADLGAALRKKVAPDVDLGGAVQPELGFVHRRTGESDVYFIANTSAEPKTAEVTFRVSKVDGTWWDAVTGHESPVTNLVAGEKGTKIPIALAPFESQVLVFSPETQRPATPLVSAPSSRVDLSGNWDVTFKNSSNDADPAPQHLTTLASWTDVKETKYFSGVATYTTSISIIPTQLGAGARQVLDFGDGKAQKVSGGYQGFRANYQPPIGDVAVIYINDKRAGAVWCAPYRLDITGFLRAGNNLVRIQVANRASNYMTDTASHPLPDYTKLNADPVYGGNRFQPQDMNRLETTPSGLLGKVQLVVTTAPGSR